MKIKKNTTWLLSLTIALSHIALGAALMSLTSCSDKEEGMGTPIITGVRSCDPETADSLFTKASPGQVIAVIGENLSSALKVYINDQEAYFNPTMNTSRSIIVNVPTEANGFELTAFNPDLNDEIRVETTHGTAVYSFKVTAPAPQIQRIQASYPRQAGDVIDVYGLNLVDIEQAYFTNLTAEQLDTTEWKEIGGEHVAIASSIETVVKDHHLNAMTNAYETTSQLRFQLPQIGYDKGTLVIECAGGTAYVPYSRLPAPPVIFTTSSDMPQIGETLVIAGREFVQVESVSYGNITLTKQEFRVAESEDTIYVDFWRKPNPGTATTLTITTPGGTATVDHFYDRSTLLTTFDGDATDNGWGPNATYTDSQTADGIYAHINVAEEAQQWWGTMVFFRKDWSGEPFALPGFDVIPAEATADEVCLAMNVYNDGSSYNNGTFLGYLRYWLPNTAESNADPTDAATWNNDFAWEDYNEGIGAIGTPVLADANGQAPQGRWYRHIVPLSKFEKFAGKTYQDIRTDGIHQFRIQSINQSVTRGKIDVKFDNVRIIYLGK